MTLAADTATLAPPTGENYMKVRAAVAFEPRKPLEITNPPDAANRHQPAFDLMHEGKSIRGVVTC
jgi:Zn-dependent alcohol dehydrogenase